MIHANIATITHTDPQSIEDEILTADGIIVEDSGKPSTWYAVTLALEKYGKPVALVASGDSASFAAQLNHPLLKVVSPGDQPSIDAFFTKHFPAPADPECADGVCRV